MLAVHLDNLLFLLLLAAAGLFQVLAKAVSKATRNETKPGSTSEPSTSKPIRSAGRESDQERVRKLLEALGQPLASGAPAPVPQPPTYRKPLVLPRVRPIGSPLPPLVTRPPELRSESQTVAPPAPRLELREAEAVPQALSVVAITSTSGPGAETQIPQPKTEVRNLFGSPFTLRNAIIIREVLGEPRGLQELELP